MSAANLSQGLSLSLWGIGITFASLGILIVIIYALRLLFPMKSNAEAPKGEPPPEHAAAISAAIRYLQAHDKGFGRLGSLLEKEPGSWWLSRRTAETPEIRDKNKK